MMKKIYEKLIIINNSLFNNTFEDNITFNSIMNTQFFFQKYQYKSGTNIKLSL